MNTPTVAGPRQAPPRGTYTGAELETRSPRAGAYDAFTLPSRIGDRQVEPGGPRASLASVRPPKPVPLQHRAAPAAPVGAGTAVATTPSEPVRPERTVRNGMYRPRPGSLPGRVAEALVVPGSLGYVTHAGLKKQFGVAAWQIEPSFAAAFEHGVFKRITVNGQPAIALAGVAIVPAAAAPDEPPAGPSVDVLAATREAWRLPFDPAAMQRFADSTAALGAALAQLEQQALVVVQAMGEALKAWAKAEACMNKKTGSSDAA